MAPRILAVSLLLSFVASVSAQQVTSGTFPKLALIAIGGPHNYEQAGRAETFAKYDVVILNYWKGWEWGRSADMETVIRRVKGNNPRTKVFLYVANNEFDDSSQGGPAEDFRRNLNQNGWWLFQSGSSGTRVKSTWGTTHYILNNTKFSATNSSGQSFIDWFGRETVSTYLQPNPSADGLFLDNVFWKPRVNGDWNRDGRMDDQNDPTVQQWLRDGMRKQVDVFRALSPGKEMIGNIADWGASEAQLTGYEGMFEGGVIEGVLGFSWSPESWSGWPLMMSTYRKALRATTGPRYAIFSQEGLATDYKSMRYGLASCLMDDGYFAYHQGFGPPYAWFDEFDVELGRALAGPSTSPWSQGVYRRDFENGIVLVNPKGNGRVTVNLERSYRKINGTQDRTVNDGGVVSTVTLDDRAGLILLREAPRAVPLPPSQIRVE